ncbi:hypothetical protein [Sinosporangium siamense]|uniref:Uncharacterized protein n=1 Tax=Sinosporangium siamense TaxID=1367973 RepID=A0A919RKW0_9ACTN|nr:hypothetical protein [Sinosporangium siamense]GII95468.1 hypothetical protein Ssi02_56990 [Sinosporangium siamense]
MTFDAEPLTVTWPENGELQLPINWCDSAEITWTERREAAEPAIGLRHTVHAPTGDAGRLRLFVPHHHWPLAEQVAQALTAPSPLAGDDGEDGHAADEWIGFDPLPIGEDLLAVLRSRTTVAEHGNEP